MKDRLFISYRRRQDAWAVGHLRDRLVGEFGREQVFFDTESLQGGQRWLDEIRGAIASASAVVVVFDHPRRGEIKEVVTVTFDEAAA